MWSPFQLKSLLTTDFHELKYKYFAFGSYPITILMVSGVPRGGGLGSSNTLPPSKFRSFDKAEPNSQFRGKYIRNSLTRIRPSLIFWVVALKALPASYDPPEWYFFSLQGMTWRKHKVPRIKKILPYEMKFLVPNYSCLQNPWLGSFRPQIPILSLLCPQLNLLTPPIPRKKIPGYANAYGFLITVR